MDTINIKIENIKSIKRADIELPLEKGLYGLVGNNGCGKSTILLLVAQLLSRQWWGGMKKEDCDPSTSKVMFSMDGQTDTWTFNGSIGRWTVVPTKDNIHLNGMYEGSLFYGTRFSDSRIIDDMLEKGRLRPDDIVAADEYVKKKLSFILHGDYDHYQDLKRVKNKNVTYRLGVRNTPYFNQVGSNLISQYRMSSGECMLVSLLHFIYNSIERKSLPTDQKILMLVDEIELALHPIAVSRLIDLLNELLQNHDNLIIYLTSHSPEVIRKIKPSNLYKVENNEGTVSLQSNCYPSYLIRDVYSHDGFDFLLLVEDELAKCIVEKIILKNNLRRGKLLHVVPVGGWKNVLSLHIDLLRWNVLGVNKQIVSILDGDVESEVTKDKQYNSLKHIFLPIGSIEKYIYHQVVDTPNSVFVQTLSDKYFPFKSLEELMREYKARYPHTPSQPDKKFYFKLKKDLEERHISEEYFITNLCDDIMSLVDFTSFTSTLERMVSL